MTAFLSFCVVYVIRSCVMKNPRRHPRRSRQFHKVDLESLCVDEHEVPDWLAGANKK
jgi:hypothetical protein